MRVDPGRVEFTYENLKTLISIAYKLKPDQITGPNWMANQRFDITAKFPAGATRNDIPQMLQALLRERLKLGAHFEGKEHSVLALVVGKGGPKLPESKETPEAIDENTPLKAGEIKIDDPEVGQVRVTFDPKSGGGRMNMGINGAVSYRMDLDTKVLHIDAQQMTMGGFAEMLTQLSHFSGLGERQLVDMTGLQGHYQIAIDISIADFVSMVRPQASDLQNVPGVDVSGATSPGADPSGGATIVASLQALGLKLEQRKAVTRQLVVDHVEKKPMEN
jgi:uncharacterized protein (TIGR03435 family)